MIVVWLLIGSTIGLAANAVVARIRDRCPQCHETGRVYSWCFDHARIEEHTCHCRCMFQPLVDELDAVVDRADPEL